MASRLTVLIAAAAHAAVVILVGKWLGTDAGVSLAIAPLITASLITGGAGLLGGLLGRAGGKTVRQEPLETPEQRAARQALLQFAQTGQYGGFQAGAEVPIQYGDWRMTGLEQQGQSALQQLLGAGVSPQYAAVQPALQDFLATSPEAIEQQFSPFKALLARQTAESERQLKRGAGYAGGLYSTAAVRGLGDIQARANEAAAAELARLTESQAARRLQAIPLAIQAAQAEQGAALQQIEASQRYGALQRTLANAAAAEKNAELLRRRQELQLPIEALGMAAGQGAQFGVPSVVAPSPYQELLSMAGQLGGQYVGTELMMQQYKRYFPQAGMTSTQMPVGPADVMRPTVNPSGEYVWGAR